MLKSIHVCLLLAIGLLLSSIQPLAHAQNTTSKDEQARASFEAGRTAFSNGKFSTALAKFRESYNLSKRPQLLFNIGSAADRLGDRERLAIDSYKNYLKRVPSASNRNFVQARIHTLEAQLKEKNRLADLEAKIKRQNELRSKAAEARKNAAEEHRKELEAASKANSVAQRKAQDARRKAEALAAELAAEEEKLRAEIQEVRSRRAQVKTQKKEKSKQSIIAWSLVGGGSALVVTSLGTLIRAQKIDNACPNGVCEDQSDLNDAKKYTPLMRSTYVLGSLGLATVASGVAYKVISKNKDKNDSASSARKAKGLSLLCLHDGCSASYTGQF